MRAPSIEPVAGFAGRRFTSFSGMNAEFTIAEQMKNCSGAKIPFAQDGVSPLTSLASFRLPAASKRLMSSSFPNAAARWSGVSPLVRQSRMKLPVSTEGFVARFGSAPEARRNFQVAACLTRFVLHKTGCSGVSAIGQRVIDMIAMLIRNWQRRQWPWKQAPLRSKFCPRKAVDHLRP